MRELICIICPVGCSLVAEAGVSGDGAVNVTGNRCLRGEVYAREELTDPKRVVTATCAVRAVCAVCAVGDGDDGDDGSTQKYGALRRVPVKTAVPCPKEKIPLLLKDIYNTKIALPVKTGDLIIENWNGSGINIIATRTVI